MSVRFPTRIKIALLLAVLAAVVGHGQTVVGWAKQGIVWHANDFVDQYTARFDGLQEYWPARGEIGYVTDIPADKVLHDDQAAQLYYLAQYALAPALVVLNGAPEYVVGNFHTRPAYDRTLRDPTLTVVHDCGNGVVLFRREAP